MMVDILLATYNGEKWLPDLLQSILSQTEKRWSILARDDGSTDETIRILRAFQRENPDRLQLVDDDLGNLGVSGNFNRLMEISKAPYIMFCDQDDVWLPGKVNMTLQKALALENNSGRDFPILIHTDMKVVDAELNTLDDSFWHMQNLDPGIGRELNRIMMQNVVTGCTVLINRALLDIAYPIPDEAVIYDWWLALVAAAFGVNEAIPDATVLYRQHGLNVLGSIQWGPKYIAAKLLKAFSGADSRKRLINSARQADTFRNRYKTDLKQKQNDLLRAWATIFDVGWFKRRLRVIRYRFFKVGVLRTIGILFYV